MHQEQENDYDHNELSRLREELFEEGSYFQATRRDEIVGIDRVLDEIDEVIHWLRHADEYAKYDARLEPGIVFEGMPGTGKTLVSRYIATESNALFVNVRDWPKNGSLMTDTDIQALFAHARRKYAEIQRPIVLFWDEFETGAIERASATPVQLASVSQLTAELDGIEGKNEGILLIGCTNYFGMIDHALLRSGRMGKHITFHAPDRHGKKLLLEYYLREVKLRDSIDVETLSFFFDSDDTAADIEEAVMEAWRYGVRRSIKEGVKPELVQRDVIDVFLDRLLGVPYIFNRSADAIYNTAIHEVGHALGCLIFGVPLRLITVQPGDYALGRVMMAEIEENTATQNEYISHIAVAMSSIIAERVTGIPASAGASGDVHQANSLAVRLIDDLTYSSKVGFVCPNAIVSVRGNGPYEPSPNLSADLIDLADREVSALLVKVERYVDEALSSIGDEKIRLIAQRVVEDVTLTGEQFAELVEEIVGPIRKLQIA